MPEIERVNPILMHDIKDTSIPTDYIAAFPDKFTPAGYELIEVVGSKMLKRNSEWEETGYYVTFRRIDETN